MYTYLPQLITKMILSLRTNDLTYFVFPSALFNQAELNLERGKVFLCQKNILLTALREDFEYVGDDKALYKMYSDNFSTGTR